MDMDVMEINRWKGRPTKYVQKTEENKGKYTI